jgi:hypothetical protein
MASDTLIVIPLILLPSPSTLGGPHTQKSLKSLYRNMILFFHIFDKFWLQLKFYRFVDDSMHV